MASCKGTMLFLGSAVVAGLLLWEGYEHIQSV